MRYMLRKFYQILCFDNGSGSNAGMRNAIGMLKLIAWGEKDIRNGRVKIQEEVFADLGAFLKERSIKFCTYDSGPDRN